MNSSKYSKVYLNVYYAVVGVVTLAVTGAHAYVGNWDAAGGYFVATLFVHRAYANFKHIDGLVEEVKRLKAIK